MEIEGKNNPEVMTPISTTSSTLKSMSVFVWNAGEVGFSGAAEKMSPTVKSALGFLIFGFLFIIISFSTPAWLEASGDLERPKFIRIGLWEACFDRLQDDRHQYDITVTGCYWVLSEELYHLNELIFQSFFVAVQFFYTMCFINLLITMVLVPMYLLCFRQDHQYYILLIRVIGVILIFSALLGSIAVITFGVMGDSRAWMPDWQNNYLSWSFAFAVVGVVAEYVAGILFIVESRIQNQKKKLRETHSAYTMETKA